MLIIGFATLAFVSQVAAHGHLSIPVSRDQALGLRQDQQNAPVTFPLISDMVCRNYTASPSSQWATLTAGTNAPIQWAMESAHPGDCFAYLSYDSDSVPDVQKKWFKIGEFSQCNLQNLVTLNLAIPSYLPSCDHCILRWEWYALHLQSIGIVEFYSQCADVKIVGKSAGQLPTPQVTIPGHLPMDANQYRPGYNSNNYKMTGPAVATIGGASYSCLNSYGSSCTKPTPTANPCQISSQRCVTSTTYQACGIGTNTTVWYAAQSCQTGLVCQPNPDGVHIMCAYPSAFSTSTSTTGTKATPPASPTPATPTPVSPAPAPKPASTSTSTTGVKATPTSSSGSPQSGSCTTGNMKCLTSETYSTCSFGAWAAAQSCQTGVTCHPSGSYIYCY